jgi:ATP dependent DNA ligase domain
MAPTCRPAPPTTVLPRFVVHGIHRTVKVASTAFVPPSIPKLTTRPPAGDGWLHEVKVDGWRLETVKDGSDVALYSRNGVDLAYRFPALTEACGAISARSCIIDGELVAADASGFWGIPRATGRNGAGVCVVAFDLLHLDGNDLRALPLIERKSCCATCSRSPTSPVWCMPTTIQTDRSCLQQRRSSASRVSSRNVERRLIDLDAAARGSR